MELRRPRMFGNCWLGCELWRQLELQAFWEEKLSSQVQRETVPREKVLRLPIEKQRLTTIAEPYCESQARFPEGKSAIAVLPLG